MRNIIGLLLASFTLLISTGCMEQVMLISVKPDGSGTMRLRLFMSDQMAGGMGMAAALGKNLEAPADGGAASPVPTADAMIAGIKEMLEQHKDEIGEGVEFVEGKEVSNQKGWKGYEALYKFKDINKITAGTVKQESESAAGSMNPSMSMGNMADFSFAFTPGNPARLEIVARDEKGNNIAEADQAPAEPEDPMAAQMAAAMMGMMKPMLAGLRMTSIIQVDGEVVSTNAKYRGEKNQNAIILYDMDLDKVLAHPDGMKLLTTKDPGKASALNLPGLRLQDFNKTVVVEFK